MWSNTSAAKRAPVMGAIDPVDRSAGTVVSEYVDFAAFGQLLAIATVGVIDTNASVTVSLVQATDSSGTGSKAISGKSATALVNADDNKQVAIAVAQQDLDVDNDFTHVALSIVTASSASPSDSAMSGGVVLGFDPRYYPETDVASVAEVIE